MLTPEQSNRSRELLEQERAEIQSRLAVRNREVDATLPEEDEIRDEGDEAKVVTDLDPILAENDLDRDTLRSEEHTSELQSHSDLVCRLLLEKKKKKRD